MTTYMKRIAKALKGQRGLFDTQVQHDADCVCMAAPDATLREDTRLCSCVPDIFAENVGTGERFAVSVDGELIALAAVSDKRH